MKHYVFSCAAIVLALSACTQSPVEVLFKGSNVYNRERDDIINSPDHQTYASDSPRYKPDYARSVEPAEVPQVAVQDLPPPTKIQDAAPAAGGKEKHVLSLDSKPSRGVEVKEQQVADISHDTAQPAHREAANEEDRMQFIWPVSGGKIISHFESKKKESGKGNDGINIAMSEGEPIVAAADGTVVYAGSELKGYGNMVIIRHKDGWMSAYAHARSLTVKKGSRVKQNDLVGYVGATGGVKSPQVHFALRKGRTPVDPEKYLPDAG